MKRWHFRFISLLRTLRCFHKIASFQITTKLQSVNIYTQLLWFNFIVYNFLMEKQFTADLTYKIMKEYTYLTDDYLIIFELFTSRKHHFQSIYLLMAN